MSILPKLTGLHLPVLPIIPARPIAPVATSITAFLGRAFSLSGSAPAQPVSVASFAQFEQVFGGLSALMPVTYAVRDFFNNGGTQAIIANIPPATGSSTLAAADFLGEESSGTGIYQLQSVSLFNVLCIPPDTFTADIDASVWSAAATYCQQRRAMLIVNPPTTWTTALKAGNLAGVSAANLGITAAAADNVAVYLPRLIEPDPLNNGKPTPYAPCGAIAGIWSETDAQHGVWKAPAGVGTSLQGVSSLESVITDHQNAALSGLGINSLRMFPATDPVVWGARTLGAVLAGDQQYTYIPVRRLALFIESTLYGSTQWAAFEPNTEPLWAALRLSVGEFLQNLFLQGAFQGSSPEKAYFVKCDAETTTETDVDNGIVNIVVGFAPSQPAEFVVIQIQQLAGQSSSSNPPPHHT